MHGQKKIWFLILTLSLFSCLKNQGEEPEKPGGGGTLTEPAIEFLNGKTFVWGGLPTGGGGYVTGIVIHPTSGGIMYQRTDVGGAYRWEPSTREWVQLLNGVDNGQYFSVDGMALDPQHPDRIYMALGKSPGTDGGVFVSENRGNRWRKILTARFGGNETYRWSGECIAVDPANSQVIWCGTRKEGLYVTVNGGTSWTLAPGVPPGDNGIRSIAIDPTLRTQERSSVIYAGAPGEGIFRSVDGGNSFTAMPGAPSSPNRMVWSEGILFVTHSTGVAQWNGTNWKDITPAGSTNKTYCGISVEAGNPVKIAVAQRYETFNNPIFRSSDGGETWAQMNTSALPITKKMDVAWWPTNWFSCATASLAFDPHNPGNLYYTDWFGTWFTPSAWTSPIDWETIEKGHEETVVLTLTAPTSGSLVFSGVCDVFAFSHKSLENYPSKMGSSLSGVNNCFSIAFCEKSPSNLAFLAAKEKNGTGTTIKVSADGGNTWTTCTVPGGSILGKIAISATEPQKMVYVAGGKDGTVYYTADRGVTWSSASGAPSGSSGFGTADVWNKDFPLAADAVDGKRFYLFHNGTLYSSSDGGANWSAQNQTPIPKQSSYLNVAARPGKTGEVWISLHNNGLYKTTDGGKNIKKINAFSSSTAISWGATASGSDIPAIFCYGTLSGVTGMYGSTTTGETWVRLDTDNQKFPAGVKALAGDRQTFGRVYVGTGGQGVLYGQIKP